MVHSSSSREFWRSVWKYGGVIGHLEEEDDDDDMIQNKDDVQNTIFFENSRINFCENLLRKRTDEVALVCFGVENRMKRTMTFRTLYDRVSVF